MNQSLHIEEVLEQKGVYVSTTAGVSMYPLLRHRKDTIVIRSVEGRLKKYDIPLYKRGEAYVLHRIVKVNPDNYVICGDNCLKREYGITDEQIIGVLSGIVRGEHTIDMEGWRYHLYSRVWVALYPGRYAWMYLKTEGKKIVKRVRTCILR